MILVEVPDVVIEALRELARARCPVEWRPWDTASRDERMVFSVRASGLDARSAWWCDVHARADYPYQDFKGFGYGDLRTATANALTMLRAHVDTAVAARRLDAKRARLPDRKAMSTKAADAALTQVRQIDVALEVIGTSWPATMEATATIAEVKP